MLYVKVESNHQTHPQVKKTARHVFSLPSIYIANVRSIKNKTDEVVIFMNNYSPDVFSIIETWLDPTIPDSFVHVDRYNVHRADRPSSKLGGGICCYVRTELNSETIFHHSNNSNVEILIVRVSSIVLKSLIVNLYFPKGSSLSSVEIEACFSYIMSILDGILPTHRNYSIFFVGDFNRVNTNFLEINFSVKNVIDIPTRHDATLDLILIPDNYVERYDDPNSFPPFGQSDHKVISVLPKECFMYDQQWIKVMDFRRSNLEIMMNYLRNVDWVNRFKNKSLDDMCNIFYDVLRFSLSLIPCDFIKRSTKDPPWITNVVKVLINKRYQAYRDKNYRLYEHYKFKVRDAIAKSKRNWGTMMSKKSGIWDIYKVVTGKRTNDWLPNCRPGSTITEILEEIKSNLVTSCVTDHPVRRNNESSFPYVVPFQFFEEEVRQMLSIVNPRKSPGSDHIPSLCWSKFNDFVCTPLCYIFNKCLQEANLPSLWKLADIVPLPKSSPARLENIRPISLLPIPERIFEKCLLKRIGNEFYRRYDGNQYAYRPKSSTACVLVEIVNFISEKLQNRDVQGCHLLSLDLAKGFDRVSRDLLVSKMIADGFPGYTITFMNNYLTSRSLRVRWKEHVSSSCVSSTGIPQGSSIGPIIFAYFVSDLMYQENNCRLLKYADDIYLMATLHKSDTSSPLLPALDSVQHWASLNRMLIKKEKSMQMVFRRGLNSDFSSFLLSDIPIYDQARILGVLFDNALSWKPHIQEICRKASSKMYVLYQLKKFVTKGQLVLVFQSCVRSVLEYCAPIFTNLPIGLTNDLEKIQNRAHRIICGSSQCDCGHFLPLSYRRQVIAFKLFLTIIKDSSHPLHRLLLPRMKHSGNFRLPNITSNSFEQSFIIAMSKMFNSGFSD